ncbi:hypothetical protein LAYK6_05440 [Lactobacillus amylovorus subsp. amylovorus]|nr:hypothetical protein LAYK6_05440 [Lactobacillus amylovorus]
MRKFKVIKIIIVIVTLVALIALIQISIQINYYPTILTIMNCQHYKKIKNAREISPQFAFH